MKVDRYLTAPEAVEYGSRTASSTVTSWSARRRASAPNRADGSQSRSLSHLDHIRSYYRALNTGDPDLVASHFTDDAVHYYTRLGPHEGARAIGENTKWAVENLEGQWWFDHGIEQGDEAVIEWAMTWRDPESGEKRINRGTEWFRMRDGRIAEVRAYHHGDRRNPQGDLLGFDHEGRGHTVLDER